VLWGRPPVIGLPGLVRRRPPPRGRNRAMTRHDAHKRSIKEAVAADPPTAYQRCGLSGDGKRSNNHLKFPSPWRSERTPSFALYDDGHWCDYGESENGKHLTGDIFRFVARLHGLTTFPEQLQYVADCLAIAEPSKPSKPKVVKRAKWEVGHPDGRTFLHHRHDLDDGTKDYRWQQPAGPWKLPDGVDPKQMLYGLDELADAPDGERVFVCEGEKATDACRRAGLRAVGTVCGCGSTPHAEVLLQLARFDLVLWPDAGPKGEGHMGAIGAVLQRPVSWVTLPDAAAEYDAADWFGEGGTIEDLEAFIGPRPRARAEAQGPTPTTWTEAETKAAALSWCWPEWLPNGSAGVIAGNSGVGKTWFVLAVCGSVIEGWAWPDGSPGPEPGLVLWLEGEARLRTNTARARSMGINTDHILGMTDPWRAYYLDHDDDFAMVEEMVRHIRPRMVVVDSWNRCYSGRENDAEVRLTLDRVTRLADETDSCWALLQQVRKPTILDDTENFDMHTIRGSTALINAATSVIGIDMVKGHAETRRVTCAKHTMAATAPECLGFELIDGKVKFGAPPEPAERAPKRSAAQDFLREFLRNGERLPDEVKAATKARGITEKTLKCARQATCDTVRLPGVETTWAWRLKAGQN